MNNERKLYHIAIDGLPGVGKSFIAQRLAKYMDMHPLNESSEDNPYFIYDFKNARNTQFQSQIYFAVNRFQQLKELRQWDLFANGLVVDFTFIRNLIYAQSILNDSEFYIFEKMYNVLKKEVPSPDVILYIQTNVGFAENALTLRNVDFEKKFIKRCLLKLNQAFNRYYFNYCEIPVLVVNREKADLNLSSEIEGIAFVLKNLASGVTRYISQSKEDFFGL